MLSHREEEWRSLKCHATEECWRLDGWIELRMKKFSVGSEKIEHGEDSDEKKS